MTHYASPTIKAKILDFVAGRHVFLTYPDDKYTKRFFLILRNYDARLLQHHPIFNTLPIGIHCTVDRYLEAPVRRSAIIARDYVLDIDNATNNVAAALLIINHLLTHGIRSMIAYRTRGTHDGVQIKIPFESFFDDITINKKTFFLIKKFYLYSTYHLNCHVLKQPDAIEDKIGRVTFRVPWTFHEKTRNSVEIIYEHNDVHYDGEDYLNHIWNLFNDKTIKQQYLRHRRDLKYHKDNAYTRLKHSAPVLLPDDFPPCFAEGIDTHCKEHMNQEMIIFATWNFLKFNDWSEEQIIEFFKVWQARNNINRDMIPVIKKHLSRKMEQRVSCDYIANTAKFCPGRCWRSNPFQRKQ